MTVLFSTGIFDSFVGFDREEIARQIIDCIKTYTWSALYRAQQSGDGFAAYDDADNERGYGFSVSEIDVINDTVLIDDIWRFS